MVSIKDFPLGELQRTRRRLRSEVLVRHIAGEGVVALEPVLLRLLRVRRDVRCLMERVRGVSATSFNLGTFSTEQALSLFRVKPADVGRVAGLLHLEDEVYPGRHRVSGIERLCIMLRRLSSPARWVDLEGLFGRRSSALCAIFLETLEVLLTRWEGAFCSWRGDLMGERAGTYAECVLEKGGAIDNCVGFMDGTGIFVARPGEGLQRSVYSGHKRTHMLKFQSIVTPDGLLFHLAGPVEGRRHDITLYRDAGTDEMFDAGLLVHGVRYCLFGDKAYLARPWLQVSFPSGPGVELD